MHKVVVGVAAGGIVRWQIHTSAQIHDIPLGFLQLVKVYLGPVDRPAASSEGVGLGCLEDSGDDLGQSLDLGGAESALGDPGGAQPDATGVAGAPIPRDRVAIQDDTGQIEDAGGHVAHQWRPLLSIRAGTEPGAYALAIQQ